MANLAHQLEMAASLMLAKVGRRAFDEKGALTTEMMILTAVLCTVAIAALAILRTIMTDTANNIPTDPGNP